MNSSWMLLALPQADMTQGSLQAMTTIWSMPLALSSAVFLMKVGMWLTWQVGVKAPGTETRITFLFLNSAASEDVSWLDYSRGRGRVL